MRKRFFTLSLIILLIIYVLILKFQRFEIGTFSRANLFYVCLALLVSPFISKPVR